MCKCRRGREITLCLYLSTHDPLSLFTKRKSYDLCSAHPTYYVRTYKQRNRRTCCPAIHMSLKLKLMIRRAGSMAAMTHGLADEWRKIKVYVEENLKTKLCILFFCLFLSFLLFFCQILNKYENKTRWKINIKYKNKIQKIEYIVM